jgi:hypothetical protein
LGGSFAAEGVPWLMIAPAFGSIVHLGWQDCQHVLMPCA